MHFNLVTIFPEFFDSPLSIGLLGKAVDSGTVTFERVSPRIHTTDRHQTVDDKPYGHGPGLVMMAEPLAKTLRGLDNPGRMIMLSPKGRKMDQALARELAGEQALTLICGRYEGIDERVAELFPIEKVCVGDFVINGGESAALCVIEAVSRLLPEFMHKEASADEESFSDGLLEYPHYTRPEEFEGRSVPPILLSGDHARIDAWRREQSVRTTLGFRPELLADAALTSADARVLREHLPARLGRNLHLCLLHHPVLDKYGKRATVSLTNLDIHDMSRVSRSYQLGGMFAATPLEDQRHLGETLLDHWTSGPGAAANPDRAEAMRKVTLASDLDEVEAMVAERAGQMPRLAATSARWVVRKKRKSDPERPLLTPGRVRGWLEQGPVLLVFGTGHGLAGEVLDRCEGVLRPLRCLDDYNHLSVRSAVAVTVDRILGDLG